MPDWSGTVNGKDITLHTLKSAALEVDVCTFGATLVAVRVNLQGEWVDVLMGYESLDRYIHGGKPNLSSVVGRCANRIAGASFQLDGQTYKLDSNNGANHLHGGSDGFWQQPFDVASSSESALALILSESDGHMGYPGQVDVKVTYEVRGDELHFLYEGRTDKPTIVNMTNHGYWNLKGHGAGNILDHQLMVAGSQTTAVDETLAITGELRDVEGTSLDLRGKPRLLREAVEKAGPIDTNYCLDMTKEDAREGALAAHLVGPNGLSMRVYTDQPGLQVYTGNFIALDDHPASWWNGKGAEWTKFGAICLEPQLWPDGIHHENFPSPILRPGEVYNHHSWHVFTAV